MGGTIPATFNFNDSVNEALLAGEISETTADGLSKVNNLNRVGTGLSVVGSLLSGVTTAKNAKVKAESSFAFFQQRARSARINGFIATQKKKDAAGKALGQFVANRAESGTTVTGSALDVYLDGVRQMGTEAIATEAEAESTAIFNEFLAENALFQGDQAAMQAISNTSGDISATLLQGKFNQINTFNRFTK